MELSTRALNYLARAEYREAVTDEAKIRAAFNRAGAEPSTELLRFQRQYGGFTFYVWKEPIVFGLLHPGECRGDFKNHPNELIIEEADEITDFDRYVCADTLYQETFSLSANGNYYEGSDLFCRAFDTIIEDYAMCEIINNDKNLRRIFEYEEPDATDTSEEFEQLIAKFNDKFTAFRREFNFTALDGYWDDVLGWYKSADGILVRRTNIKVHVLAEKENSEYSTAWEDFWDN